MGIWLVMTTADGGERPFPIHKSRTVIGRSPTSDVRISVPTVAPHHCELSLDTSDSLPADAARLGGAAPVVKATAGRGPRVQVAWWRGR